jgi:hypothetical protein
MGHLYIFFGKVSIQILYTFIFEIFFIFIFVVMGIKPKVYTH